MKITSIGIIGLGSFGDFVASLAALHTSLSVVGFDIHAQPSEHATKAEFSVVAKADIVVLAVPLSAYPEVLQRLRPLLPESTLLMDVCSVKSCPEQLIRENLPDHKNILLTHPLFGPQTAPPTQGHELIVTESVGSRAPQVLDFCRNELGLKITRVTSEEHDRVMAQVQALTFFVAEGLAKMELPDTAFTTPSYQLLTNLVDFQRTHSDDLFQTVQTGNPFAGAIRRQLIERFEACDQALEKLAPKEKL